MGQRESDTLRACATSSGTVRLLLGALRLGELRLRDDGDGGLLPRVFQKFWSTDRRRDTTARLGFANAIAGLAVRALAPILGAIADRGARRKQFMLLWTLLGAGATGALYFVGQGEWFPPRCSLCSARWVLTAAWSSTIRCCSTSQARELDRVSSFGYALGYLGGGVLFLVNVVMVSKPALFGLADATRGRTLVVPDRRRVVAAVHDPAHARRARVRSADRTSVPRGDSRRFPGAGRDDRARSAVQGRRAVPARVLVLHRRREHHHQDGGELWRVARARHQ